MDANLVEVRILVPKSIRTALKIVAAEDNLSMRDLVVQMILKHKRIKELVKDEGEGSKK